MTWREFWWFMAWTLIGAGIGTVFTALVLIPWLIP